MIEYSTEVAMEILASTKFENKNKIADGRFATSKQSNVEQLKENSKNQNSFKNTDQILEDYEYEELAKMLQILKRLHCIIENVINKRSHELACAFLDLWSLVMFGSFQIALAFGSCNFDTFETSLTPINYKMHSHLCDFLYLLSLSLLLLSIYRYSVHN